MKSTYHAEQDCQDLQHISDGNECGGYRKFFFCVFFVCALLLTSLRDFGFRVSDSSLGPGFGCKGLRFAMGSTDKFQGQQNHNSCWHHHSSSWQEINHGGAHDREALESDRSDGFPFPLAVRHPRAHATAGA